MFGRDGAKTCGVDHPTDREFPPRELPRVFPSRSGAELLDGGWFLGWAESDSGGINFGGDGGWGLLFLVEVRIGFGLWVLFLVRGGIRLGDEDIWAE